MSRVKLDLLWSPNREDKFVTFGTELCLYKIESIKDKTLPAKGQSKKVSDETFASVLSVNSDNQYMKVSVCVHCACMHPSKTLFYYDSYSIENFD